MSEWDKDRVQVGTQLAVDDVGVYRHTSLHTVERLTPAQVVTRRYRIHRESGRIVNPSKWGPRWARIATDADVAAVTNRNTREAVRATDWSKVSDDTVRAVWALVQTKETPHDA